MAISDDDLELDDKTEKDEKPAKSKKMIFIIAGVVVLALSVGAGLYFTGIIGGGDAPAETSEDGVVDEAAHEATDEEEHATETIYHKFKPAFVVNFEDKGKLRFLQIDISVSTKKPSIVDELVKHEPVIRNNLVLLYSSKTAAELNSREGKEKIRQQTLEEIQKIMQENVGNPGIDDVFFTGFVVQ